jgi:hypothetical protein
LELRNISCVVPPPPGRLLSLTSLVPRPYVQPHSQAIRSICRAWFVNFALIVIAWVWLWRRNYIPLGESSSQA